MATLLLCLMPASAALAQESAYDLAAPTDLATGTMTYSDLVTMAFPRAVLVGDAMVVDEDISLPHIEGPDFTMTATAPVEIDSITSVPLSVEGRPHLALMLGVARSYDGAGPITGLALFDITNDPVLVDIKDVAFDRLVGFAEPSRLTIGEGQDLILVNNSHGNSGQYYKAITIVDVVDGELQMVDMVMTLDDLTCAGSETQAVSYAAAPASAARADFEVTVTDVTARPEEVCEGVEPHQPSETRYSVTYRWDDAASRYVPQGDGWRELDDLNSGRF